MKILNQFKFYSVQAIGWIPFYKTLSQTPEQNSFIDYAKLSNRKWFACDFLFFSGNNPRPDSRILESIKEFDQFLEKSKNYRGALALRNIKLDCFEDGTYKAYYDTLKRGKSIGYTPYRNFFSRKEAVLSFKKGSGGNWSEFEPSYREDEDGVLISHMVYFRIGWLGNLAAKILTGHFAPKAKMRVDYKLRKNGTCTVYLSGSFIPSQDWCLIGIGKWNHDMMKCNVNHIKVFFEPQGGLASKIAAGNYVSYKIDIP